ncbi:MAG TPA: hypothetical protein PKK10_10245 [Woeseiaceae bacterium]|nr:hypothetical protein [Woeseiaceae bacterium]
MNIQASILVVAGSISLTVTLMLAWCLTGIRYLEMGFLKKLFPSYQYLLKSHIDYLLMTGLLMVFFLLFDHFRLSPPAVILLSMTIGSLLNPFGFLVLAIKPNLRQHPATPFGAIMTCSFLLTTIGYIGAAWSVAHAAVLTS